MDDGDRLAGANEQKRSPGRSPMEELLKKRNAALSSKIRVGEVYNFGIYHQGYWNNLRYLHNIFSDGRDGWCYEVDRLRIVVPQLHKGNRHTLRAFLVWGLEKAMKGDTKETCTFLNMRVRTFTQQLTMLPLMKSDHNKTEQFFGRLNHWLKDSDCELLELGWKEQYPRQQMIVSRYKVVQDDKDSVDAIFHKTEEEARRKLIEWRFYKCYKKDDWSKYRVVKKVEDAVTACLDGSINNVVDISFRNVEVQVYRNGWVTGRVTTKKKYDKKKTVATEVVELDDSSDDE